MHPRKNAGENNIIEQYKRTIETIRWAAVVFFTPAGAPPRPGAGRSKPGAARQRPRAGGGEGAAGHPAPQRGARQGAPGGGAGRARGHPQQPKGERREPAAARRAAQSPPSRNPRSPGQERQRGRGKGGPQAAPGGCRSRADGRAAARERPQAEREGERPGPNPAREKGRGEPARSAPATGAHTAIVPQRSKGQRQRVGAEGGRMPFPFFPRFPPPSAPGPRGRAPPPAQRSGASTGPCRPLCERPLERRPLCVFVAVWVPDFPLFRIEV